MPQRSREQSARKRPSQADVARHAGVSPGIVSSVINNRDYGSIRVSQATRERVLAAVQELGYVPNLAARSLARGSNRLIAVFTYESMFPLRHPTFYYDFVVGIEEAADAVAHNLLLVTGAKENGRRSIYAGGVNNLQIADGGLLLGSAPDADEVVRLAREGYPFVFVGRREYPGVELSYVAADYRQGVRDLMRRVHGLGHRSTAMVIRGADGTGEAYPARRAGYRGAVAELGIAGSIIDLREADEASALPCPDADLERDLAGLIGLIREKAVTALLVESSGTAIALRRALADAGLSCPQDVSIVSLGGADPEQEPADMAALEIPRYAMGSRAVHVLLELLASPDRAAIRVTLPVTIRDGATLAAPPA